MAKGKRGNMALRIVQKYHPNVTKVVDARRGTKIEVTENDCKTSKMKAPDSCAMATAFCRKHDGAIISLAVAYLVDGNKAVRYRVPSSIAREIVSFDRSKVFAPGTYSLCKPAGSERLGFIREKRPSRKPIKGKKQINRAHKTAGIRSLYQAA